MMKMRVMAITVATAALTACAVEDEETTYRVLPVAAQVEDGREVLVGTYDESTRELTIVPAFVAALQDEADGPLRLLGDRADVPLALEVEWADGLAVGDVVRVVPQDDEEITGARLSIHDEAWVDGLTEDEAASAFPACWDPDPCDSGAVHCK